MRRLMFVSGPNGGDGMKGGAEALALSDCIPRVFDVTQLVPVTTRVMADDEPKALLAAMATRINVVPVGEAGIMGISVGFPESYGVKEVTTDAST